MEVALALVGSFAVGVGIVVLIIRSSHRAMLVGMAPIARGNDLMRRVAEELDLRFVAEGADYGTLTGTLHGAHVEVRVKTAYYQFWIQLLARAPNDVAEEAKTHFPSSRPKYRDGWLVLEPKTTPIRAGRYTHFMPSEPRELRAWLEDLANFIRSKTA